MAQNNRFKQDPGGDRPPVAAPTVSLPKGGGAIRGIGETFAANPAAGTGSLTVPLPFSPGRSGFGPGLSLTYDSGAGNGPFGYGWNLTLPRISRKTEKGLPTYRDEAESDVYLLAGAEDLIPARGTDDPSPSGAEEAEGYRIDRYRPRTEAAYARIERWTKLDTGEIHWRSVSRDNVTSLYGRTAQSQIADPDDPNRRAYAWLICESYDDKGNAIVYEYKAENDEGVDRTEAAEQGRARAANRYLKRVRYGNRVSHLADPDLSATEWLFEAVFDYGEGHEDAFDPEPERPADAKHRYARATAEEREPWAARPDPFSEYRAGFEIRTRRRCRRMLMFHRFPELGSEPCLVRSVAFGYEDFDYGREFGIEEELRHPGSSRFGSFLRSVTQSGFVRKPELESDADGRRVYLLRSYPPLEFEYGKAVIREEARELDEAGTTNLPAGVDGTAFQWANLEGDGLTGVLTNQAGAWHYKPNLGEGRLGPMRRVSPLPAFPEADGDRRLVDLDGDGRLEWASFCGPSPGYSTRRDDGEWEPDRPFASLPNLDWDDPNLRFVDLDGDGRADILITEQEAIVWYPSLGTDGFGPASLAAGFEDEERGPRLVLADGAQSVYLADMSGDGLADLVRIRNGEVCYWPNLGYGRFGPKVTMDDAPWFDHPDQFDRGRIRLADLDGSGTTDIVYAGREGVALYFNQSGNRLSRPRRLRLSLPADAAVDVVDLLGGGTACLVWSTARLAEGESTVRYMDLMGGRKPNLLIGIANNLGTETKLRYAPSTKFYAEDALAGRPWLTKLPFPVQTLERVETYDRVSGNRFVTRYAYHHGYYDGIEREFRGFGLVEQWDSEEYATAGESGSFPSGTNADSSAFVPPALTKTWYHIGACDGRSLLLGNAAPVAGGTRGLLFDDAELPADWTEKERREACRGLRGMPLREEIYAMDGTEREVLPYLVREHSYVVRCLQRLGDNRHAAFDIRPRETLVFHCERGKSDPRIEHELILQADEYGNALKTASVAYGRANPAPDLEAQDAERQGETKLVYTEHEYTNAVDIPASYRAPLPSRARAYELTGPILRTAGRPLTFSEVAAACSDAAVLEPGESPDPAVLQKRLFKETRTRYRRDDLKGPLPFGRLESKALPYESYKLAFTPALVDGVYGGQATDSLLAEEGRYARMEGDDRWWVPSGRAFYSQESADTPERELAEANAHFYVVRRYRDPFHTETSNTEVLVRYDRYDLLVSETRDALGNRVAALETDYRVLQPACVADPNGNRSAVRFDALGLVTGTAVMGKAGDVPREGDALDGFAADLTEAETLAYLNAPEERAYELLGTATKRLVYDWFAYRRTRNDPWPQPAVVSTLARETHDADLPPGERTAIQRSFAYYDGLGREIQKKLAAEPGPVPKRDPDTGAVALRHGIEAKAEDGSPVRWVGDGWTVYNNKGLPVRRYEPFFTDTHRYERDAKIGVGTLRMYDPIGREVASLHPDHTWEKIVFDPWSLRTYRPSDTVLAANPKDDPDVGAYFRRLPEAEYLPSWYDARIAGELGPDEQDAARKAAVHADTPAIACLDSLGRAFLSIELNRFKPGDASASEPPTKERYATRIAFDIEGRQREVIDALGRTVMRFAYDMLGNLLYQSGTDGGERRVLVDVSGRPIRTWNGKGDEIRTVYDALRRPVETIRLDKAGVAILAGRTVYGESMPEPERSNLRGQVMQVYDQAGLTETGEYDFKGNPLVVARRLAKSYKTDPDWSADVSMEEKSYVARTRYDALNRKTEVVAPDGSVIRTSYNESNLPQAVKANLRGESTPGGMPLWSSFVTNIDYDEWGRRTRLEYGNGAVTTFAYDRLTRRLAKLETRRPKAANPDDCPDSPSAEWPGCGVQRLSYAYDPAGNITRIRDEAQQTVFFRNRRVEPVASYSYDAMNRLVESSGREHLGLASGFAAMPDAYDGYRSRLVHPGDGLALGTYVERYEYDAVGNLLSIRHRGADPKHPGWMRCYQYAPDSNRLLGTGTPGDSASSFGDPYPATSVYAERYTYDEHGNMTSMPHLRHLDWDYRDRLRSTAGQTVAADAGTPETTWYVYDAAGMRVRKVTERQAPAGVEPTRMKERVYLGPFEIYREYRGDGETVELERETLHILDGRRRIALAETRTQGSGDEPARFVRYQLGNHLGSASLELDERARIISYEEYYPFGSTSYQAARSSTETPKRYRYSGKERDEESGLYCHDARYYSPWLGRWTSADPLGIADGVNGYAAFHDNPLRFVDPSGLANELPSNFIEYAESKESGLKRMAELGVDSRKEVGLGYDPATRKLMLLEGGSNEVYFGKLTPIGHSHTGVDTKATPSNADLTYFAERNIKEHWIYGSDQGWARIAYDAKTNSFEVLRTLDGNIVRSTATQSPEYNPQDLSMESQMSRWRVSDPEITVKSATLDPATFKEGVVPARGRAGSQPPAEPPKTSAAESPARSLSSRIGSAVDAATPGAARALEVAGAAYAAYDIATKTEKTTREKGALMGVAQAGKTSAKHASAALWFAAGGAIALTLVTGGAAAPLAAAAVGALFTAAGTIATHSLIDEYTPGLE